MKPSNQFLERFKSNVSSFEHQEERETYFYGALIKFLKSGQFDNFKDLVNYSINFNIFIDMRKIPDRFNIISRLLLNCTDKVSNGYQTSALGDIINILKFCNEFNLLDRNLSENEILILENIKKDKLFLANLFDLFGKVSNAFIFYIYNTIPRDLYEYFINSQISYFPDQEGLVYYIKNIFFNQYSIYGLSVRYLSPIEQFVKVFKKNYTTHKNQIEIKGENNSNHGELIEFSDKYKYRTFYYDTEEEHEYHETKKHLVSPKNILKNFDKILDKNNYNFYSLSMVLLGGLGPQGLGFTYSTPKGEVVEICSDSKQNKAIIIKFKKFLKNQFIDKLGKEMNSLNIKEIIIKKILNYLIDALNKEESISYFSKDSILYNIKSFLIEDSEYQDFSDNQVNGLVNKITNAIQVILRPIKMMDQYKARMNLVAKGLLKSEDIAKLTSLKEKSHYDILRERFFFQYIVSWFYEIYYAEKEKSKL